MAQARSHTLTHCITHEYLIIKCKNVITVKLVIPVYYKIINRIFWKFYQAAALWYFSIIKDDCLKWVNLLFCSKLNCIISTICLIFIILKLFSTKMLMACTASNLSMLNKESTLLKNELCAWGSCHAMTSNVYVVDSETSPGFVPRLLCMFWEKLNLLNPGVVRPPSSDTHPDMMWSSRSLVSMVFVQGQTHSLACLSG